MPKGGRKGGHKGRARQYTSPEEIGAQLQAEKQKAREEEEQGEEGGDGAAGDPKKEKKSLDSDESEDEEDDYQVLSLRGAWDLDSSTPQTLPAPVVRAESLLLRVYVVIGRYRR